MFSYFENQKSTYFDVFCLNCSIETKIKTLFLISYFNLSKKRNGFWVHGFFQLSHGTKNIHRSKLHSQHTHWRKTFLQLLLFKVCCESFRFGQIKKLEMYFGLYESSFTFIEKIRPNKYCFCGVNLISYMQVFSLIGQDMNLARKIAV